MHVKRVWELGARSPSAQGLCTQNNCPSLIHTLPLRPCQRWLRLFLQTQCRQKAGSRLRREEVESVGRASSTDAHDAPIATAGEQRAAN